MEYIFFFIGILLLVKGADCLVVGASSLARKTGVSKLTIGLTVVALGTTLPELIVSMFAAARGEESVVFGNIIGSCLANVLLILGIMALLTRLRVKNSTTWKEIPFAFLAVSVLTVFALRPLLDANAADLLSRTDGLVLMLFFAIFLYYVFELAKKDRPAPAERDIGKRSGVAVFFLVTGGALALYFGGGWTVGGAVALAGALGMSEFFISATIIAIGTSLPELITAVVAASKNNVDLAVGNIIGSNILNIFLILGATSVISPLHFPAFIKVDIIVLLIATTALFLFMFTSKRHELDRWEGLMFLLGYTAYMIFLIRRG